MDYFLKKSGDYYVYSNYYNLRYYRHLQFFRMMALNVIANYDEYQSDYICRTISNFK